MDPNYITAAAAVIAAMVPLLAEIRRWRKTRKAQPPEASGEGS